jgi:type I restriction enzyme M protein
LARSPGARLFFNALSSLRIDARTRYSPHRFHEQSIWSLALDHSQHNRIVGFIWGIADDVLRDIYVRGKYRDVILPMTVIRRLDVLLEPTKDKVLEQKAFLDKKGIHEQRSALQKAAGRHFYNTSPFTLRKLLNHPSQIKTNFETYLEGFSENVQEILRKFDFRNQLHKLENANVLFQLIEKFLSKDINLSPEPVKSGDGKELHTGLSNLGMGYVFEELLRKFNEENNEEAGEHFTPREIIRLMAAMIFRPIKKQIKDTTYLVYDCACGSGGMLTEAEAFIKTFAEEQGKDVSVELYGQEINPETFAICQSDMIIKERKTDQIKYGSTLSRDGFPALEFDFMLANPPYGKSWKTDLDALCGGDKKEMKDMRFAVEHDGKALSLVPRSSDGQLLFLVNFLSKMKRKTEMGSRVATVHNGSALFTGDAGQGESNIRQWILENDWLEAIVGLPENMFYNTGIATYIWVLSNRKPEHRKGKVQLIDATQWFTKLRKNLGKKNCEFSDEQLEQITKTFLDFKETEQSKIFDNADFGYWQITVERPLRLRVDVGADAIKVFRAACVAAKDAELADAVAQHAKVLAAASADYNAARNTFETHGVKLSAKREKLFREHLTRRDESAAPVIKARHKDGRVEYEPDADLRDHENVPLKEKIDVYFKREVLPHVPDAWIDTASTGKGYEISFTKYFYHYQPLRSLDAIAKELTVLEHETEGLLKKIIETGK